jgi:hypothetical protein
MYNSVSLVVLLGLIYHTYIRLIYLPSIQSANQTTNVNANVEVINGGYGIKNPSFSAPKVQDFPEQCGKLASYMK